VIEDDGVITDESTEAREKFFVVCKKMALGAIAKKLKEGNVDSSFEHQTAEMMLEEICDRMEVELKERDASSEARGKFKDLKKTMIT